MRLRLGALVLPALALIALTGCTTAMPVPGTATKAPLATAAPAAGSTLQPAPAPSGTPVDATAYTSPAREGVAFTTTDGNTTCSISDTSTTSPAPFASCTIVQKDFAFPDQAAGTPSAVAMSGTAKATVVLTAPVSTNASPLAAGRSITWSTVTCLAIENGIRCTNTATTHGFFLSRITYELF